MTRARRRAISYDAKKSAARKPSAGLLPGRAIQVFVLRVDAFLGTELFSSDVPINIGRHQGCAIHLEGETVSRFHCHIELEDQTLFIEDLGSANGTLVNSQRINKRTQIVATDAVQIGDFTLKVRALIPRNAYEVQPTDGITEQTTRKKAILSADGFTDSDESHIDLGRDIDPRLYEAALRRATGNERAVCLVPLVIMDGGRRSSETDIEREQESPASQSIQATETTPAYPSGTTAAGQKYSVNELKRKPKLPKNASHQTPFVQASRHLEWEQTNPPVSLSGPSIIPATDHIRTRTPQCLAPADKPQEIAAAKHRALSLDVSKLQITPKTQIGDQSAQTELELPTQQSRQKPRISPRLPKKNIIMIPRRRRRPAPLVTSKVRPIWANPSHKEVYSPYQEPVSAYKQVNDSDILNHRPVTERRHLDRGTKEFRGVEITTLQSGHLTDITRLTKSTEEYILGHPTPQGAKAPSGGHNGLRLIRINKDRTVDLVFPRNAGGGLVREGEEVMFAELAQGRKYSSVRLIPSDQATLILNHKGKQVTYLVQFLGNAPLS